MALRSTRLLTALAVAITALASLGLLAPPAGADTPIITPRLTVNSAYTNGPRFTAGTEDRDGLPQYTPYLAEQASGRAMPIESAYASPLVSGSDYESYGFNSVEKLVVGTTYYVSLRVTTTGYYSCSIYNQNGCSWRNPTDYTYQWTFVYAGAIYTYGTPYYTPETSALSLHKDSWRKSKKTAKFTGSSTLSPSCLCRPMTVEGYTHGRWVPLRSFAELRAVQLRVPYKYKQIRLVVAAVTSNVGDGGTLTTSAATSNVIKVPNKPKPK